MPNPKMQTSLVLLCLLSTSSQAPQYADMVQAASQAVQEFGPPAVQASQQAMEYAQQNGPDAFEAALTTYYSLGQEYIPPAYRMLMEYGRQTAQAVGIVFVPRYQA